ncbi:hypothetical protein [Clostridium thermosuccinogenes]|uniref:hypothetical protein n=1 Tax=Clostridium thermosuccinogenes TaxID=84032 RepID=UPI00105757F5|nr:hypothetical protein [Pseudoclostridium thermosuccinogenes]
MYDFEMDEIDVSLNYSKFRKNVTLYGIERAGKKVRVAYEIDVFCFDAEKQDHFNQNGKNRMHHAGNFIFYKVRFAADDIL